MRILDEKRDHAVQRVSIFLTRSEAGELRDSLQSLLDNGLDQHVHVPDSAFEKEITVAIYDEENLSFFDERVKRLIKTGH